MLTSTFVLPVYYVCILFSFTYYDVKNIILKGYVLKSTVDIIFR